MKLGTKASDKRTARDIDEIMRGFIALKKREIEILVLLIRRRSTTRKQIGNNRIIHISNVAGGLKRLKELGLIHEYGYNENIKLNSENIKSSCLWLYEKRIQKLVFDSKDRLGLGMHVQCILYLLCKIPEGILQNAIINNIGLTTSGFHAVIRSMEQRKLIKVTNKRNNAFIFPIFNINLDKK